MSGPIVRRYGFPNFENIFGKRELEHGVDENENEDETASPEPASSPKQGADESKGPEAPSGPASEKKA